MLNDIILNLVKKLLILFFFLITLQVQSIAQVCTGSFGDPVVNIDFGRGSSQYGPSLGSSTNYQFVSPGYPEDGQYTIAKSTNGMLPNAWHQIPNHTPNDPDGYMMIVNASHAPGIFYEAEVPVDLCPNTTYEFAAWVINLITYDANKPRIVFYILSMDDQVLGSYDTQDIQRGGPTDWKQYSLLFHTLPNINRVKIRMVNSGPGGQGNDIAIDDITFRACGAKITPSITGSEGNTINICEGQSASYDFSANVDGPSILEYQWQVNTGSGWTDLPGMTNKDTRISNNNWAKGTYQYRLSTAVPGNIGSPTCRTVSSLITVNVLPLPVPIVEPVLKICAGKDITLNVDGAAGTYVWNGPNGYTSTEKSPVIPQATIEMTGNYTVTVTSGGCSGTATTRVDILPVPVASVDNPNPVICPGSSVPLQASGGTNYTWSPVKGLSDPNISNPVATPDATTRYTVTISNGTCESTAEVLVTVLEKVTANAGKDKKIRKGHPVQLDGQATGANTRYLWTPATGLDDPTKLQPMANPEYDTIYTLQVSSDDGCPGDYSSVAVKVLEKIMIPNAFSPNGDNVNDYWNIEVLETYPQAELKVVDRYGRLVFEGTKMPWDGKYKGKDVPVGAYFYIIKTHDEPKEFSGSIMIIR